MFLQNLRQHGGLAIFFKLSVCRLRLKDYVKSAKRPMTHISTHCAWRRQFSSYKYGLGVDLWSFFGHNLFFSNIFFAITPITAFTSGRRSVFQRDEHALRLFRNKRQGEYFEQEERIHKEVWENFLLRNIIIRNLVQGLLDDLTSADKMKELWSTHNGRRNSYKILDKVF